MTFLMATVVGPDMPKLYVKLGGVPEQNIEQSDMVY